MDHQPLRLATAAAVVAALKGTGAPIARWAGAWLVLVAGAGLVLTHVVRGLPTPALVPLVALAGLALGFTALGVPAVAARFAALDDRQWRLLTMARGVFGALILAAGAAGLFPIAFAVPAGLGDLLIGALALAAPGSLAAEGPRGARLLVFGLGLLDFIQVIALQALVLVPWLAQTKGLGISLLLPWVVVPLLATLNVAGLRLVVRELLRSRPQPA